MLNAFGLFNTKSPWKLGLQAVNVAAIGLAVYELYQDPTKLAKVGLDMTAHMVNIVCLRENVSAVEALLNIAVNFTQLGALYTGSTSGCSQFNQPGVVSVIDALVHGGTATTVLLSEEEQTSAAKLA